MTFRRLTRFAPVATAGLAVLLAAPEVRAHRERDIPSPVRPGPVPDIDRVGTRSVVVCKPTSKPTKAQLADIRQRIATETGEALAQAQAEEAAWQRNKKLYKKCRYEHIQEAVNAAGDDVDILVMPGVYREEPSRAAPTSSTGDLPNGAYSYEYHVANPNDGSLIGIIGRSNVTLEGTGARPEDVLIDGGFAKDVGVRCDRCTGFIIRNLWTRDVNEHAIYVVDSDGYIFDRTRGSFAKAYELFAFASDNGIFTDCEAEGGGDSGIYVGGSPTTPGRFASEIRRCKMHHNALGFSGTQGNSVWMHDNDVYDNAIGLSFDSENDHPNFPQGFSVIENNLLHDNNFDIYAATSDVPAAGPGYDFFQYPVGTGMWIVGGVDNVIRNNFIWNNIRFGVIIASNAFEAPLLAEVHRNQVTGNIVGKDPDGNVAPNSTAFPPGGDFMAGGSDFFWDGSGNDNCWGPQDPSSGPVKVDPDPIPGPCPFPNMGNPGAFPRFEALQVLLGCSLEETPPGSGVFHTADTFYPCPWGQTNDAPYQNRDEAECGNGVVDLGEDCDGGYGGPGGFVPAETCDSLGQGGGTLACGPFCTWDTTACEASGCREYGAHKVKMRRVGAPGGDDTLDVRAAELSTTGLTFDPTTEAVSLVVRDQTGQVYGATIPAGTPGWSSSSNGYTYADPAGTHGGIIRAQVNGTPSLGSAVRTLVKVRGASLGTGVDAQASTAIVRVGNDCWADSAPCTSRGGVTVACKARALP